jgi:uncharacterized protein (DUF2147 family)
MSVKFLLMFLFLGLVLPLKAFDANSIVGNWKTAPGTAIIQIYKAADGSYQGKIIKTTPKPDDKDVLTVDKNNPKPELKSRPIVGLMILKDFKYDGEEWGDGTIYDPKNGKDYSCKMWLEDKNTLKIRGYIGISLFGRTEIWTKVE